MPDTPSSLTPQDALVALMIAVSFSDETIRTTELVAIQRIVNHLPIFNGYDADRIRTTAQTVFDLFEEEDGLDALFGLIRDALPERLHETAYALSCDVAAADGKLRWQVDLLRTRSSRTNTIFLCVSSTRARKRT